MALHLGGRRGSSHKGKGVGKGGGNPDGVGVAVTTATGTGVATGVVAFGPLTTMFWIPSPESPSPLDTLTITL